MTCSFCGLPDARILISNEDAVAIFDGYPVSPGHSLIIPKRHIASLFEATREEQEALINLLAEMRGILSNTTIGENKIIAKERRIPHGFNIGINDGFAAGQTVMHLHIHLIPRYVGDNPDPRGGIRWIFPDKANYWDKS